MSVEASVHDSSLLAFAFLAPFLVHNNVGVFWGRLFELLHFKDRLLFHRFYYLHENLLLGNYRRDRYLNSLLGHSREGVCIFHCLLLLLASHLLRLIVEHIFAPVSVAKPSRATSRPSRLKA